MSRSRAPELVQPEDIHEFTLDSQIVKPIKERLYGERVIHGEIYKARPEVNAVCHHHAPSILPFCISGMKLEPVYHLGASMGAAAPFWDARDDFGNTSLIVAKPEEGASLARTLGKNWIVLMRRHGATVAGRTLEELTFRTIYVARNATYQLQAHTPRPRLAAQCRGDRTRRHLQSAARAGGARLGVLVGAARQGGRPRNEEKIGGVKDFGAKAPGKTQALALTPFTKLTWNPEWARIQSTAFAAHGN